MPLFHESIIGSEAMHLAILLLASIEREKIPGPQALLVVVASFNGLVGAKFANSVLGPHLHVVKDRGLLLNLF